jgi:hypothetical protein
MMELGSEHVCYAYVCTGTAKMAANPAPEPDGESLHIVAEEMRHREQVQDAQIQILATKATYLFTAGTASVGAAGAYLGLVADDVEIGFGFDFIALSVTGLSYVFLCVCFSSAYFVRDFVRAPDPEELMKYLHMPPSQSLEDVADSRRSALEAVMHFGCGASYACWYGYDTPHPLPL